MMQAASFTPMQNWNGLAVHIEARGMFVLVLACADEWRVFNVITLFIGIGKLRNDFFERFDLMELNL